MRVRLLILILLPLWLPFDSAAQSTVKAVYVDDPPHLDGRLDDPAWEKACLVDRFIQREPRLGDLASEKTEVLICYDRTKLYFGFRCHESNPSLITAKEMARDVSLGEDDRVQVILDTFLDGRNAYWFQIGPRGSIGDALVSENGDILNKNWDGLWDGRARIHSGGWDAEIAIPFKTLTFRPGAHRWGLKLIRHIRRKLESSYWPVANVNTYRFQVSDSGILEGMDGITQGIGLDATPYALTGWDQKVDSRTDPIADLGIDINYQITPSLKSSLTINTDFAQTEADTRQVNLTRFPLFFPEKRDFFLEGSNYFSFGPSGQTILPFFSRRIGLDSGGNPISMLWGARVTGQFKGWNIGFLDAMDDRGTDNRNFAVARVRRNLGSQSSLGFIFTDGNSFADIRNSVLGADFKFASSSFRGSKNIALTGFALKSRTDGISGRDEAFGAEVVYPNDLVNVRLGFNQIGNEFVAGAGFVPRSNIRDLYFQFTLGPRPKRWGILQMFFGADGDYITDLNNRMQTRRLNFTPLNILFKSGDIFTVKISPQYECLDKPFLIRPPHAIPAGSYSFVRNSVEFQSAPRRNFWVSSAQRWGSFYNGSRNDTVVGLGYKVRVPLYLGLEYERDRISVLDGRFATNISRFNANVLFRPNITLYSFLQFDNVSQTLGWQSRFRWILAPGNEVQFVWNSRWVDPLARQELTASSARIKIRYNFQF